MLDTTEQCRAGRLAARSEKAHGGPDKEQQPGLKVDVAGDVAVLTAKQPVNIFGRKRHGHAVRDRERTWSYLPIRYPGVAEIAHQADIGAPATAGTALENRVREARAQALVDAIERLVVAPV